jgi:hypothetical protein
MFVQELCCTRDCGLACRLIGREQSQSRPGLGTRANNQQRVVKELERSRSGTEIDLRRFGGFERQPQRHVRHLVDDELTEEPLH